jgi:hypothetical protein
LIHGAGKDGKGSGTIEKTIILACGTRVFLPYDARKIRDLAHLSKDRYGTCLLLL